eukprot:45916-Rhodomonas_salina.2
MVLRACCVVTSTDMFYGATRCPVQMYGATDCPVLVYGTVLRACNAVSGTDVRYGATCRLIPDVTWARMGHEL